jgi:hypothetical protein
MGSNVIVARTPQPCSASGAKSDYSQAAGGSIGTAGQAIHQPWLAALAMKPAGTRGSF